FTLNNIGFVYQLLADYKKAREFFEQALQLSRTVGDRLDEAYALLGIGVVYSSVGENQKALEPLHQALSLFRTAGFRFGEAYTLTSIGKASDSLGEKQKALNFFNQALVLSREAEEGDVEGYTLPHLMSLWKSLNRPGLAIFYGKQAINAYQRIRSNIRELDEGLRKSFLTSKEDTYRQLADLLISEGRLPEAQQVLGLLKEEEYFQFVRRDQDAASLTGVRLSFTPAEADLEKRFREIANQLAAIGAQREALLAIKDRTTEQEKRLSELEAQLEIANQAFQKFLDQLEAELKQMLRGKDDVGVLRESQALKETLRELDAIALYTIVGQDKFNII
ncbi:MAG: tetratricopeptide repeat protein, partial [Pyrinomonadaceae bacterium]